MNTIDQYSDAKVIRAFLVRNFSEVGYEFVDDVITKLKDYAFAKITDLKTLGIPSVTVIPTACFYGTQVSESVDISWDKITSIGCGAFRDSNVIKESTLNLPECTEIGTAAFHGQTGLTSFTADKWTKVITTVMAGSIPDTGGTEGMFQGSGLQSFSAALLNDDNYGSYFLQDSKSLASVNLPVLEHVRSFMFQGCTALTEISLPKVKTMDMSAFNGCTALTSVSLPLLENCTGQSAFNGCTALEEISLPSLTGTLGGYTFSGCRKLAKVSLPKATGLGNSCFSSCSVLNGSGVGIPEVTSLGGSCFYSCIGLTEFSAPKAESIGLSCFAYDRYLVTVDLPAAKTLNNSIFNNCQRLEKVTLGGAITAFPASVFSSCSKLKTLILSGVTSVPTLSSNTFSGTTLINTGEGVIYVPDDLVASFQADSSWSGFNIQALSAYTEESTSTES